MFKHRLMSTTAYTKILTSIVVYSALALQAPIASAQTSAPAFPPGSGLGGSVCSATSATGPYQDIGLRWEFNGGNPAGSSPDASIDRTDIFASATPGSYNNLSAKVNSFDLNIDADTIPDTYNPNAFIQYQFTTTAFTNQAELTGIGATVFEKSNPNDSQATGTYRFAIAVDDDASFGSPDVLINDLTFDGVNTSSAAASTGSSYTGNYLQAFAHWDANGTTVKLEPSTTYTMRVYPYSVSKNGDDNGQSFENTVLWDDFMPKAITCAAEERTPIEAGDDDFTNAIIPTTGGTTASVFADDEFDGTLPTETTVDVSLTDLGGLTGATINPDGTIDVPLGATAGTYTLTYQICEAGATTNCDIATVMIEVIAPALTSSLSCSIAQSVVESSVPSRTVHTTCSADVGVTSDGVSGNPGYCPSPLTSDYEITYAYNLPTDDRMYSLKVWANAGGVYNDDELRSFDLEVDYTSVSGIPATLAMGNVTLGDTTNINDPKSVIFTEGGQAVSLPNVSEVRISNLGAVGGAVFRELQGTCGDDYSDAPANYLEAVHSFDPQTILGATNTVDLVTSNNNDDLGDDGVTLPTLIKGESAEITVAATGAGGFLQGWIDFNGDGDFDDTGEHIAIDLQLASGTTGTINVPVDVPADAVTTETFARFRWSRISGLNATDAANNGEVEDYALTITEVLYDYEDASGYGTARHEIIPTLFLGATNSVEVSGYNDISGDDGDDGITFPTFYDGNIFYDIPAENISATGTAKLHAWIDFDDNGSFDTDEYAVVDVVNGTAQDNLSWSKQADAAANGPIIARFRLTTGPLTSADAATEASDGEVEDYQISTTPLTYTATCTVLGAGGDPYLDQTLYYRPVEVIEARMNHLAVLGAPDAAGQSSRWTTLGRIGGELVATFTDNILSNTGDSAADISIREIGDPESASVHLFPYAETAVILEEAGIQPAADGSYLVGIATAAASLDIDTVFGNQFAAGRLQFGAVKLVSTTGSGDGPDMDAITAENSQGCSEIRMPSDYSDAPILIYGEASHVIGSGNLYLGSVAPDAEASARLGTDNGVNADGDNATGSNDEDGIVVPSNIFSKQIEDVTIPAADISGTGSGTLHAWIDFNGDGAFGTSEYASVPFSNGATAPLVFSGYGAAGPAGTSYARFRLTSDASVTAATPVGSAIDGEVEDYPITILPATPVQAAADDFTSAAITATGGTTASVFADDDFDGALPTETTVDVTLTDLDGLTGATINPDGTIEVPAGATAGTYTLTYQICEAGGTTNCDTATVIIEVTADPRAALTPFVCTGSFYQINNNPSNVSRVDLVTGQFETLGNTGQSLRATGFDTDTGLAYSIQQNTNVLFAVDANAIAVNLGAVTGLPTGNYASGDFGPNGYLYVRANGNNSPLYAIDVNAAAVVEQFALTGGVNPNTADFAFNPVDGSFYSTQSSQTNASFLRISLNNDPANPTFSAAIQGSTGIQTSGNGGNNVFGAMYADSTGDVFGIQNRTGRIFQFSTVDGASTPVGQAASASQNDGFVCSEAVAAIPRDFGDAQTNGTIIDGITTNYGSASQARDPGALFIGAQAPTAEASNVNASDNADGDANEDVTLVAPFQSETTYSVTVPVLNNTGNDAFLCGFIDADAGTDGFDGTFDVGAERTCVTVISSNAAQSIDLNWTGLDFGLNTTTFLRLRLSTGQDEAQAPTGDGVSIGEVEDYAVTITELTPIDAVDDDFTSAAITTAGGTTASVFADDDYDGALPTETTVDVTLTDLGGLTGATINPDGTIEVPAGATAGTYTLTYQICEAGATTNCDTATVIIEVVNLQADLSITKTNTPGENGEVDQDDDSVTSGQTTTYTLVVTNNGPDSATGALVKDAPGSGLTCEPTNSLTLSGDGVPTGDFTIADLTGVGITLDTLADGQSTTLSYSCEVN